MPRRKNERALAHPQAAFVLRSDKRVLHDLPSAASPRQRISDLFGEELGALFADPAAEVRRFAFSEHNWHDYEAHARAVRSEGYQPMSFTRASSASSACDAAQLGSESVIAVGNYHCARLLTRPACAATRHDELSLSGRCLSAPVVKESDRRRALFGQPRSLSAFSASIACPLLRVRHSRRCPARFGVRIGR